MSKNTIISSDKSYTMTSKLSNKLSNKLYCDNKILASKIVYCIDIWRQGTGLMCRSNSSVKNTAWWFKFTKPRKVAITMFMVFFPIDILLLDKENKIVELKQNLIPFSNYFSKNAIYSFIELESGTIVKHNLKIGMSLN